MKQRIVYLFILLVALLITLVVFFRTTALNSRDQITPEEPQSIKPEWNPIIARAADGNKYFMFYVPPDMETKSVRGVDSFIGQYQNSNMELYFDYGVHSDPLTDKNRPQYKEQNITVGNHVARIVTFEQLGDGFRYFAGIHFNRIRVIIDGKQAEALLTMYARCKTPESRHTAIEVFRSIRINEIFE